MQYVTKHDTLIFLLHLSYVKSLNSTLKVLLNLILFTTRYFIRLQESINPNQNLSMQLTTIDAN